MYICIIYVKKKKELHFWLGNLNAEPEGRKCKEGSGDQSSCKWLYFIYKLTYRPSGGSLSRINLY